tara:strand:+ start:14915 stop:17023 length:2109 start_codon:yes stop_codon:yes gene_type:complete
MRLYFGRIAPTEPQQSQLAGGGWSWRYKVRIFDKHPPDKNVLSDDDLPWAQVLLPVTAGSGAANYAQTPSLNQGDTVSIAYYDEDEQQPVITGILPRTDIVSNGDPSENGKTGYLPHSGFTENKNKNSKVPDDESNQNNLNSQPSKRTDKLASAVGSKIALADTCDPNGYKASAVTNEINNLLAEIQKFTDNVARVESMIAGTIDRVHALVNPYVGEMIFNLFDGLVPLLNAGLSALYKKTFAAVLAATQNPAKAKLAAEAVLIALQPPILILQEAIQLIANEVVSGMLTKIEDLVRDTIENNDNFSSCAGAQFNSALVNSIINDIDDGISPLLRAVATILSGGFSTEDALRSTIDIVRDFAGGLLALNQSGNKCSGLVKEYIVGLGAADSIGDILDDILKAANVANGAIEEITGSADSLTRQFGDFPFLSEYSGNTSAISNCTTDLPTTCFGPQVQIFGGRGEGATAEALVGRYVDTVDERTITDKQGGVVSIEVTNGGEGYIYPPFVEITDNCGLGIGAVARSVINREGKVIRIYIVTPGEGYPSSGEELFVVNDVQIITGGFGYSPGIVQDQYGGRYEVLPNERGTVINILPINIVQIPNDVDSNELIINIPSVDPPIPPGGTLVNDSPIASEPINTGKIYDANGKFVANAIIGSGLTYTPVLVRLPTAEQIAAGEISDSLTPRLLQTEVVQVIDCVES